MLKILFDSTMFEKDPQTNKIRLKLSDAENNGLTFNSLGKLAFTYAPGEGGQFPYSNIPGNGISGYVGSTIKYVGADSSVARKVVIPQPSDPSYPAHAVEGVYLPDVITNILA